MKTTLLGRQATHESSDTPGALAKAFEAADAKVPEKRHAVEFLTGVLEPGLRELLDQRANILRGMATADGLDALARAELAPSAEAPQSSSLNADLPTVERAIQVKRRAIELQRAIVDRAEAEWGGAVCDRLVPIHRAQVRRIAAAIEELSSALAEHRELVDALRDGEVMNFALSLRPMLFAKDDTMLLSDENSSASLWMRDARDNGLLAEGRGT